MDLEKLIHKAKDLLRFTQIFVEAEGNNTIAAYVSDNDSKEYIVKHESQWMVLNSNNNSIYKFEPIDIDLIDLKNYKPLTTIQQEVYPNFEHLMHFGDHEIKEWVNENDCDIDDLFDLQSIYDEDYGEFWMDSHPMFNSENSYGFAGGWAMIWSDDESPLQWDENLVFLYQFGLIDEPFVEIYYNKTTRQFICIERNS